MLTEMLSQSQNFTKLPIPEQTIIMTLAREFQSNTEYLFMSPDELTMATDLGNKDQWTNLLQMNETVSFIKGCMAFLSQVNQRKTFRSLVELALSGNAQAAKQVQELSGIMNQQDTNRTIVLHSIPRPKKEEV